jgi:glycosyltransferase involved in cell wall biosynthesis
MRGIMIEASARDNRRLRIAFVTTELAVGGAEQCLARLAIGLAQRGFQPAVYSLLPPPAAPRDRLVRQLAEANIPVHYLGLRHAFEFRRGVRLLAELLERQRPDLIQSFLFHANILATFATRRLRRTALAIPSPNAELSADPSADPSAELHAELSAEPDAESAVAPKAWAASTAIRSSAPSVRLVTGWRVADQRPCRARLEARLTRNVDHVVCVSQAVAEQARRLGLSPSRLSVIPNGVDTSVFTCEPLPTRSFDNPSTNNPPPHHPPSSALPASALPAYHPPVHESPVHPPPTLLAIGRLDRQKGFDWLLQDANRLLESLPGFRLAIVGEGPERARLAARIHAAGLADRVELPGWQDDIARRFHEATLVLIPSRWEGMPNVLLEAMASGRAVVATRVEGVEELLGPEAAAQSVPVTDLAGFIDRAIALARDSPERTRLGIANASRVRGHFSIDKMIDAYATHYVRLCDS